MFRVNHSEGGRRRHCRRVWPLRTLALLGFLTPMSAPGQSPVAWMHELRDCEIDRARIFRISGLTIRRDSAEFELTSGRIHFFKPQLIDSESVVTGALFLGDGRFRYTPPSRVEQRQLALLAGSESVNIALNSVYMRFSDRTEGELLAAVHSSTGSDARAQKRKRFCEKFIDNQLALALLEAHLLEEDPGFFYAQVSPLEKSWRPYVFEYDPFRLEEVRLERRESERSEYETEVFTSHRRSDVYEEGSEPPVRYASKVDPIHYSIDCKIEDSGEARVTASVDLVAVRDLPPVLSFDLPEGVSVSAVFLDDDEIEMDESLGDRSRCLILPRALRVGEQVNVAIHYEGPLLRRRGSGLFLRDPFWYPTFEGNERCTYELVFTHPREFEIVAVGHAAERETSGTETTVRWHTEEPVGFAPFSLGRFNTFTYSPPEDSLPTVTVHALEDRSSVPFYWSEDLFMDVGVAHDVADASKFLSWLYGRCGADSIVVTEVPYIVSMSFPGLVHLSWASFVKYDSDGGSEAHRAHEVAHQWWGNSVRTQTYHDAWIAEGFAEYAGYWYAGWAKKDEATTQRLLGLAQRRILRNRRSFFKNRSHVAPLWQGMRTSTSKTERDYWILVYEKGAFVLHMIRSMLEDLQTGSDGEFIGLMRDFYQKSAGRRVSTGDFQRAVSDWIGMDMGWFFDQWVYGTEIPHYRVVSRWDEQDDGTYKITCRVKQSEVSPGFQMYVTVRIILEDERSMRVRVLVEDPEEEIAFAVPGKPKRVIFNDGYSVLAEVTEL